MTHVNSIRIGWRTTDREKPGSKSGSNQVTSVGRCVLCSFDPRVYDHEADLGNVGHAT